MKQSAKQPANAGQSAERPAPPPGAPGSDRTSEHVMRSMQAISESLTAMLPGIEFLYRDLHAHPELSGQETRTSGVVSRELSRAGYEVTENVGGHGVVALLRNGDGPTVAIRGDMDALPVEEKTGLPYASKETGMDAEAHRVPVMHACGHDVHTACLVGTARLLATHRKHWNGAVMVIAQPAEETGTGAAAMLADGLFVRFPRPNIVLGQHVMPGRAGSLVHRPGTIYAASHSLRIHIFGVGGHGSQPHLAVDPIVIAAAVVTRLQTIVSRELGPYTPGVVTVGSLHAGSRPNIIPDNAVLELTVRVFDNATAERVLASIDRIVQAECTAGRSPRPPRIEVMGSTCALVNDAAAVDRVQSVHRALFGDHEVLTAPFPLTGSEDFAFFAQPGPDRYPEPAIPVAFWMIGGTGPERWNAAGGSYFERLQNLPSNHNPGFYPDPTPTLRRGVEALTSGALAYLGAAA